MGQLKIESKAVDKILKAMQVLAESNEAKDRQKATKYFCTALAYYPDKQVMVATDARMMYAWKINDDRLIKNLKRFDKTTYFEYKNSYLKQLEKAKGIKEIDYKSLMPKFDCYIKIDEIDIDSMKLFSIEKKHQLLQYACICSRTRFNPIYFNRLADVADWDILEFVKNEQNKPIMFKSNKSRLMALLMPLKKDPIQIHDK